MSWQDQGRKEHGWFGDGTAPQAAKDVSGSGMGGPDGLARRVQNVVYGAVGALPPALRRRAEGQLDGGGLSRLSEAMTAWSRGSGLGKAEWAERMLGRDAADPVAGLLRVAALGTASAGGPAEGRQASEALAGAMQVVGLDHWPRFVADAQALAAVARSIATAGTDHAQTTAHPSPTARTTSPARRLNSHEHTKAQNIEDLARVIWTEARGQGVAGMTAVGWTLRNRMTRNNTSDVSSAWHGYRHGQAASATALRIAAGILDGTISDPTNGSTHFYTPSIMPKKGDKTSHIDVGGGLESTPGVSREGAPVENYRPSWALTFERNLVPSIPEGAFKFYRQPGIGRVP